ncbi:MAG: response regulator transcription factor [Myxococcales bacterium]|nr:response regulator transcription factor [Myxococcales bacterium]
MQILLVEDTQRLAEALVLGLEEEAFEISHVTRGAEALASVSSAPIDAIVLDLGLPDCDGVDILRQLRRMECHAPVLILTARDAVASRVDALEAGADDYLVKPFAFAELVARLRALLRRSQAPRWAPLVCGDLELVPDQSAARVRGQAIQLSPRERQLLEVLLRRQEDIVSRPDLLRLAFGYDFDPGTNIVDVHVAHLRRKLRGSAAKITTVRGVGLMLTARRGSTREPE